jgi:hypothetical protein
MEASQPEKEPHFWFILERVEGEEGRPHMDDYDLELWGNIPIPVYDRAAFAPPYEVASLTGTRHHKHEATVTLQYADIRKAAIDAGRMTAGENDQYWEKLASISFPQRLGRIVLFERGVDPLNAETPMHLQRNK